jgi:Cu+-exporting ATPase
MSTIKKVFKIIGMHCVSCSVAIDGDLEDTEGIKSSNTNYARQETSVEFDPEKISEEKIIQIIAATGYTAKAQ